MIFHAIRIASVNYFLIFFHDNINLILEQLPFPYDEFRSAFVLLDRVLPASCKCLFKWRNTSYLQPIYENQGVMTYINKECRIQSESHTYDFRNADLLHEINDYIA